MHKANVILPAVAAAIFDRNGNVLLQRRKDVDQWGIISGHVEFGESVEEAMLREIYEETGSRAELTRFIGVYSSPRSQTYDYDGTRTQYVTTYFEARLIEDIPVGFKNEESLDLRFFNPSDLPQKLALMHESWLLDALNRDAVVLR